MKSQILKVLSVFALLTMVMFTACRENVNPDTSATDSYNNDDAATTTTFGASNCPACNNCVYYVRCKLPSLPGGLTSYTAKKNICNAWSPVVGYAVVMPSSAYPSNGHIAYVQSVNSDGTITIGEGNVNGKCATRTKKPTDMSVYGYWKP